MSEASWDVAAWLHKPGGHHEAATVDIADRKRLVEEILEIVNNPQKRYRVY